MQVAKGEVEGTQMKSCSEMEKHFGVRAVGKQLDTDAFAWCRGAVTAVVTAACPGTGDLSGQYRAPEGHSRGHSRVRREHHREWSWPESSGWHFAVVES